LVKREIVQPGMFYSLQSEERQLPNLNIRVGSGSKNCGFHLLQ
jgi:hypothetical protein